MANRELLIFVSDLHLTEHAPPVAVPREALFERFWIRVAAARGERPAHLVFVGDLFDIVRSPTWFSTLYRPYLLPDPGMCEVIEQIVDRIIVAEKPFFDAVRRRVEAGALNISFILGNHDRLLAFAPRARRRIWKALTGRDEDVVFPEKMVFPEHAVLAYHGNQADFMCNAPDGTGNMGDAIGSELIVRFPMILRERLGEPLPELDEIDDVRPIYAVPAWVRHYGARRGMMKTVATTWKELVDEFQENPFVREWMRGNAGGFGPARQLNTLLQLSTGRIMRRTSDHRLAQLFTHLQTYFDGRFASHAADLLMQDEHAGLRYVINGHSHFASMVPLGLLRGQPACYFNTGSWRTVHQMGRLLKGRPAFLKYESMSYVVFFPDPDEMGRDYEWWNGVLVPVTYSQESGVPALT
ncbi:MAG: hypothetical protein KC502_16340 [Myxococcales bacterium]|nr:hypothetical protein [Myxococcales bacterium]